MNDYADSLENVENIREAGNDELLTKLELKVYRKMVGKIAWLSQNCRPDIAFVALDLSRRQACAAIKDLKRINVVLERIRSQKSEISFTRVGDIKDLVLYALSDGSYNLGQRSVGGGLIILGHRSTLAGVPLHWKSKTLQKVCTSAKASETHSLSRVLEDVEFFSIQLKQVLFKDDDYRIPIKVFVDSRPLLESIGSIHQVENKLLRNNITIMKNTLYEGTVFSFSWLDSNEMLADIFTKDVLKSDDLMALTKDNVFLRAQNKDNLVVCVSGEIKFLNKTNKKKV
jgi:hypothetical protein